MTKDYGMHAMRRGLGKPLLLVHGLGATWQSWEPVLPGLSAQREVIAIDLPGFGDTPPLDGDVSIATLADAVTTFLREQNLLQWTWWAALWAPDSSWNWLAAGSAAPP